MNKSIKRMVMIRVVAALVSVLLFSFLTTYNVFRLKQVQAQSSQASMLLDRAQRAEAAHYKWASNLSNALYAGTEFTGSIDDTGCVLGQWLYGEAGTEDETILNLRAQMKPLHKELHQSADYVLGLLESDPVQAHTYYQQTIQGNLTTLVGLLDQVVEKGSVLSTQSAETMSRTLFMMQITTGICLLLALACLLSLVQYVLAKVVKPILQITEQSKPLQAGKLELDISYQSQDELGELAGSLNGSVDVIHSYVADINRIMDELSKGNFDVRTATDFIGDFASIQASIESFTSTMSEAMERINRTEHHISENASQLSSGAQTLAQGATEQASAVEEMYATLDDLSRSAEENVKNVTAAQKRATQTGEQVTASEAKMEEMVTAMAHISSTSQQISQIITTIENIAFQTNILALNAAVEAARAGAAGKGFAVVANEVRSLAGQSDQAAKATKELIENSVQATAQGSSIVVDVSEALKMTLELVTQSNHDIGAIAQAVQDEAASITQVKEGVGQISSVVQTNSASSEESAAVSRELFDQVRALQGQTQRFKLKQ